MTDYGRLIIQRRLDKNFREPIFQELYEVHLKGQSVKEYVKEKGLASFGNVRFIQKQGAVFYEHTEQDEVAMRREERACYMNLEPEWLICFSYSEMRVIGFDMGVFEAETSVESALERLYWSEIKGNSELDKKRNELYQWLKQNARPFDRIRLCSDWIYYSEEGTYDYEFVKKDINRRIAELKKTVRCPHWTNKKRVSLAPEQQTLAI